MTVVFEYRRQEGPIFAANMLEATQKNYDDDARSQHRSLLARTQKQVFLALHRNASGFVVVLQTSCRAREEASPAFQTPAVSVRGAETP